MRKKFGFPSSLGYEGYEYRADTASQKSQLVNIIYRSERLWNEQGTQQQTLLRKCISILNSIITNETTEQVQKAYIEKQKQIKDRLINREQEMTKKSGDDQQQHGLSRKRRYQANTLPQKQFSQLIATTKPDFQWQKIIGLQGAKKALKEDVLMPIRFPELFTGKRKPWKGILLYGPQGPEKTQLVKASATQGNLKLLTLSFQKLIYEERIQASKNIKLLFEFALAQKPSMIYIDDIDLMFGKRTEDEKDQSIKSEFLSQMALLDNSNVIVICASILPWQLDPSIRKSFERKIFISPPDQSARLQRIKQNLVGISHHFSILDLNRFARKIYNLSLKDIDALMKEAVFEPIRRIHNAKKFKKVNGKFVPCSEKQEGGISATLYDLKKDEIDFGEVNYEDLENALKHFKPSSEIHSSLKDYQEFTKEFGQNK